ncbi:hypothetical protein [Halorhabdus amylolytica]|uniref:hypothetical protein n=1 Tax=Halorhabdus amylolytica TaxID=2559573 RepID=UPI0010AB4A00|nr:hypothetical protein [Halorhabdus amylolytica]
MGLLQRLADLVTRRRFVITVCLVAALIVGAGPGGRGVQRDLGLRDRRRRASRPPNRTLRA